MATRIIVGLAVIAAVIQGLWPELVPMDLLPLALVLLGLVYGAVALDAEDATGYLVLALAVGAAAGANVLEHIPPTEVGTYLDAIVDQISVALYAAVITVLAMRTWNRLMPSGGD